MPRFKDPTTGFVSELTEKQVELNPQLFGGFERVADTTPITSTQDRERGFISSSDLTQTSAPKVQQPEPTPIPPTPSADSFAVTPKEAETSDLIKRITGISERLAGAEAFRIEKEKEFGLVGAEQTEQELLTQLKQLELEAKTIPERLQLAAEGRGITAGGLAPIEAGELRKISIASNATAALLLGAQGRVTAAQRNIDNAVRAKYGPLEAEQKALITNLELLLKDPTLSAEQKARAEAQRQAQEKKENERKKKEADAKTILEWAVEASKNGATTEQSQAIANIGTSDEPDLQKALSLAAPFLKPQTTFEQRLDAQGNLVEFERDARGKVISQRVISTKVPTITPVGAEIKPVTPEEEQVVLRTQIKQLPAGQQDSAFGAIGSFKNAKDISNLLDAGAATGFIAGRIREGFNLFGIPFIPIPGTATFGLSRDVNLQFDAAVTAFTANYIKALSGVQVSDREREFLLKSLPSENLDENKNRQNLKTLLDFLKNKYELQLGIKFEDFPTEIPSLSNEKTLEDLWGK